MNTTHSSKFSSSVQIFAWSFLIILLIGLGINAEYLTLQRIIPYCGFMPFCNFLADYTPTMMTHTILGTLAICLLITLIATSRRQLIINRFVHFSSKVLITSQKLNYLLACCATLQSLLWIFQTYGIFKNLLPINSTSMAVLNMSLYFIFMFTIILLAVTYIELLQTDSIKETLRLQTLAAMDQKIIKKLNRLCAAGVIALLFQAMLGYYLRKTGLSLACDGCLSCSAEGFFPTTWNQTLAFTHRWWGVLLIGLFVHIAILGQKTALSLKKASLASLIFSVGQLALGFLLIYKKLSPHARITHFSLGLLLWSSLSFCYAKAFWANILMQKQESHNSEAS